MKAGWMVLVGLLILGGIVTVTVTGWRSRANLPAGQNQVVTDNSQCPPRCTKEAETARAQIQWRGVFYDSTTRQPMPEGVAHLQFVADAVRCPVSSRSAVMASCVVQRYKNMRDKALSARARYEALVGLERAYWAALAREGLTQRVEHVPSGGSR